MKIYRKIATVLAAATLMLGFAGNAMAYFEAGKLIRVVYDLNQGIEYATDLGSVTGIIAAATPTRTTIGSSFLGGSLASSVNLKVAYFAYDSVNKDLWVATRNATEQTISTIGLSTNLSAVNAIRGQYNTVSSSTADYAGPMTGTKAANSYYVKMEGTGTKVGKYNTLFGLGDGTMSLAALAEVSQTLHFWDNLTTSNIDRSNPKGLTIYTLADGTTQVATPIPPAFFLLGSGLLGLIGLRRRMA